MFRVVLPLIVFLTACLPLNGQDACTLPASPFKSDPNILSPQQEMYLGELVAAQGARDWNVIPKHELNARLELVGETLLKHLPPSDVKYSFTLVDLPMIDAFGLPGGHIYVTRKLVAFLKSDDELAALLAHEIGHIYTHQQAIDFTRLLREKLGIQSVRDNDDLRRDFNLLLDQWRSKSGRFNSGRSVREQEAADQLGLYALARAGYPPEIMAQFFDRLAETHGKTGNFLSDLFGVTSDENFRLRAILKNTATLPATCIDTRKAVSGSPFADWQRDVMAFSAAAEKDADFGDALIRKTELSPPLQDQFRQIRFSPDGHYLLVQDESGITILKRDPLSALFRISEPDATPAGFTPDSAFVVFYTTGLRVQRWSIAEQKQVSVHEIFERQPCLQTALSPDGNSLVCFDREETLRVFDVETGNAIYEKKHFAEITRLEEILMEESGRLQLIGYVRIKFDPAGKILIAASASNTLVLELATHQTVSVPSSMKARLIYPFTFLTSDRLVMISPSESGVYEFPSGKLMQKEKLGGLGMEHAGHGNSVFLRPVQTHALGLYDLDRQKLIMTSDKQAVDAYDDVIASEGKDGKLLLTRWAEGKWDVLASTQLPRSQLTQLQTVAVSADMNWMALSLRDRGGVYKLDSGEHAIPVRGFRGAYFISGPALFSVYPKDGQTPRTLAELDLQHTTARSVRTLPDDLSAAQLGPFLVVRRPDKHGGLLGINATLEIQDVVTGKAIFSQYFPRLVPAVFIDTQSNLMMLAAGVTAGAAKNADSGQVEAKFSWPDEKQSVYDIQVIDLNSGNKIRDIHIDSGKFSFAIRSIDATRDYLALADNENRVQLYSMKTGQQIGIVFGGPADLSGQGLMSVVSQAGQMDVYDCATLKRVNQFHFPAAAIYSHLSNDGERLLVLTVDQTVYLLRTRPAAQKTTQTAAN
ncbi:MAG TPA: M48 family metalloprotease [Terriglobales bacterium]|nr:M48 family metalloprotease [Terriglobales bacterium]